MIRIAITGPESSGKTTLSKALTEHYDAELTQEFAREYLEKKGGAYIQSDLDKIALGHLKNIQSARNPIQIIDTDFIVLEVWSRYKYNNVSEFITGIVDQHLFDLHILCAPDVPWEPDALRESPDDRSAIFEIFKSTLKSRKKNHVIVNGSHNDRLKKSIQAIDAILI